MKESKIMTIIYAISILIVFVALAQVAVRTFIDYGLEYPEYNCSLYGPVDVKVASPSVANMTSEQRACEDNYRALTKTYDEQRTEENKYRFIACIAISLLTLLVISLVKLKTSIHYGFFSGLILNILFSMGYIEDSYTTVGILLALLIILVYYINKKKD